MSDSKGKNSVDPEDVMMTPETLKETLGELASNIDSLVDNLTMDTPDAETREAAAPEEHPFEELPPDLANVVVVEQDAPAPAEASAPIEVDHSDDSIGSDAELVGLAEGLIDSVESRSRDASGNTRPEPPAAGVAARQWMRDAKADKPQGDGRAFDVFSDGAQSESPKSVKKDDVDLQLSAEFEGADRVAELDALPDDASTLSDGPVTNDVQRAQSAGAVESVEKVESDDETPAEQNTTASVVPWSASEKAAPSTTGGALWKIAAALAAVGLLGGGWFFWNGRVGHGVELTELAPPVNRTQQVAPSKVVLQSSSAIQTASLVGKPAATEGSALSSNPGSTPTPTPTPKNPAQIKPAGKKSTAVSLTPPVAPPKSKTTAVVSKTTAETPVAKTPVAATPPTQAARQPAPRLPKKTVPAPEPTATKAVAHATVPAASTQQPETPAVTAPAKSAIVRPQPDGSERAQVAPHGQSGPPPPIVTPPKLIQRGNAEYTARARKRGETGVVELRLLVGTTGRVRRVVVEHGMEGSDLEASAINAALRSSYEPAHNGEEAIEAWIHERFVFEP